MAEKITPPIYLALVHAPVLNKKGEEVVTSVTNLDLHDIARTCQTFGWKKYFVVTPLSLQQELVGRIIHHWESDEGSLYNPDRAQAFELLQLVNTVEEAVNQVQSLEKCAPKVVVTGANFKHFDGEEETLIQQAILDKTPILLLFGTGWGLPPSVTDRAHFRLRPISGPGVYNHLSVRSAVAIYSDRLHNCLV